MTPLRSGDLESFFATNSASAILNIVVVARTIDFCASANHLLALLLYSMTFLFLATTSFYLNSDVRAI